jgi:hypothetical protein
MTIPCIDHGLLSPSGRMSKRARVAAMKRETARLFAGVEWAPKPIELTEKQKLLAEVATDRKLAQLALGSMQRKLLRRAEINERKAQSL